VVDNTRFRKLLEPYHIGRVKTRNRMIKTAAETCFYNGSDGYMSETCKAFYETLAKGGVGVLYVEGPAIDGEISMPNPGGFRIDDDKYIPALSEMNNVFHKNCCPKFIQLING
jgi:2,4-dienoyl-CoA reductase-like NADH-dependent reductase (Old Yellow Enzyme family)